MIRRLRPAIGGILYAPRDSRARRPLVSRSALVRLDRPATRQPGFVELPRSEGHARPGGVPPPRQGSLTGRAPPSPVRGRPAGPLCIAGALLLMVRTSLRVAWRGRRTLDAPSFVGLACPGCGWSVGPYFVDSLHVFLCRLIALPRHAPFPLLPSVRTRVRGARHRPGRRPRRYFTNLWCVLGWMTKLFGSCASSWCHLVTVSPSHCAGW
ncbi:hypothetical protein F4780DRAFT_747766 [Xylariomycetidae sp. FL0641]|nr:hypothetical protein F4780DRAFT_747766 [Xylariomycetidae sp. FL0641]